ncbi:MAG: IQ calmodulin-binding motif-containing protein [Verrucomicrobia bacterium]|nr:IQ calmodulin-binding motif-containing protein [Verrucomicrobiota bacterium]MBS0647503.1 IQ calmodulin-binding motif-containing protein [Verrucomicrobiota bacterium]
MACSSATSSVSDLSLLTLTEFRRESDTSTPKPILDAQRVMEYIDGCAQQSQQRHQAAASLQSMCRGYLARRIISKQLNESGTAAYKGHTTFLKVIIALAKQVIDEDVQSGANLLQPFGQTDVYHAPGVSVVFRDVSFWGEQRTLAYLDKPDQVRALCKQHGWSHIEVASHMGYYRGFSIETRASVDYSIDPKMDMGLYSQYSRAFSQAVTEFVEFLCHVRFFGLREFLHPYSFLMSLGIGNYNKIGLQLRQEDGKAVGKVIIKDLQDLSLESPLEKDFERYCEIVSAAVAFFPHHTSVIINVLGRYEPKLKDPQLPFEYRAFQLKGLFHSLYSRHQTFVKTHGIGLDHPSKMVSLQPGRATEIKEAVVSALRRHQKTSASEDLGENAQHVLGKLERKFDVVLQAIFSFLKKGLEKNLSEDDKLLTTEERLLSCRTLIFSNWGFPYVPPVVYGVIQRLPLEKQQAFAAALMREIFNELCQGEEIVGWYDLSRYLPRHSLIMV